MISFFFGRSFATSVLSLRSTNGLMMLCSFFTTRSRCSSTESALKSNQLSKSSRLPKTSGMMKLSSDHSSFRLFCSGVPDSRRRLSVDSVLSSLNSRHS